MKKQLVEYFESLGINVHMHTKARGHQGFFVNNRIDVSKNISEERIIPTLLHEFAHYIHNKIEKDVPKTGGTLQILFDISEEQGKIFEKELIKVTHFVDEHSLCLRLKLHKEQIKKKIKIYEDEIKLDYPKFMRSKKFKEFDKYIKKSKAKHLLKYDRIKLISPFLRRVEVYSIDTIERDFKDMPKAFVSYIRLKSYQKKQTRTSSRINKLNKYYQTPTELFSRFVEGLYLNEPKTQANAPIVMRRFKELLEKGYYLELSNVFKMLRNNI